MRTVYACYLHLPPGTADAIWNEVTDWVGEWYERNAVGARPPTGWSSGGMPAFTHGPIHFLEASLIRLEQPPSGPLRELRWRYPDAYDPSLVWSVDTVVYGSEEDVLFYLLLRIASDGYELLPAKFTLGSPRVIRNIVARGDARIGAHEVSGHPQRVEADDVQVLVSLIRGNDRRHAVVVISPEPFRDAPVVDPEAVANATAGLAAVYVLGSKWAGFALSDELGRGFSCFNGAVRIYWPRFTDNIDGAVHRLWLPSEIAQLGGSEGLARSIFRLLAAAASFRFGEPEMIRSFRRRVEEARIAAIKAERGGDYDTLFADYVKLDAEVRELRDNIEGLTTENANFRANLAVTWLPTKQGSPAGTPHDERPTPANVHEAVVEAQRRTSYIIYLAEAFESARESPFKQPDKAYSALLAIDDVARQWAEQLEGGKKLGSRKDAFRQRGFEYKDDISQTSESRWGDEYTYNYENQRVIFAPHITMGAKQPDKCLSIHLHWDEKKRRVAVAHVGRHKTNTKT